ncbi:hypothetical protein HUJ04_010702 [Dendroctonus ponderosae]|nr:hypothetical protein HUJ04_010702 [Dendroctonus ponderosae]
MSLQHFIYILIIEFMSHTVMDSIDDTHALTHSMKRTHANQICYSFIDPGSKKNHHCGIICPLLKHKVDFTEKISAKVV